jgi:hypothetical protein
MARDGDAPGGHGVVTLPSRRGATIPEGAEEQSHRPEAAHLDNYIAIARTELSVLLSALGIESFDPNRAPVSSLDDARDGGVNRRSGQGATGL